MLFINIFLTYITKEPKEFVYEIKFNGIIEFII